jgi:peptide/nickel transport system substrate-binding protein
MRAVIAAKLPAWLSRRGSRRGVMLGACTGLAGLAITVAGCGTSPSSPADTAPPGGGTTATYALAPDSPIDYIFPFVSATSGDFTVYNANDFQYLMYRPLYWFGAGTSPLLNTSLSLAYRPVYKGQQVTIRLKPHWKWSDGEPVDAKDVMFWMNMLLANRTTWAGYVKGYFPDNVKNVHPVGTDEVQMTITGPYSETWFTNNELSQITPMPMAWDVTGPGKPSNCAQVVSDCLAVYKYLNNLATNDISGYGNPKSIWQVVDGPWRVQSVTTAGGATLVFNNKYSGKVPQHHITRFVEEPFTSEQVEFDLLQDPEGSQTIDVGYLPTVDAPPPSGSGVGANPSVLANYNLHAQYVWQLSYFPYNFANPTAGPIFRQLYFRQAFQDLVDQEGTIDGPLHGYGKVTIGPVADFPVTPYLSPQLEKAGDQWPLSLTDAQILLRRNGWSVSTSGGTDTCIRPGTAPGDCGAGITAGTPLKLSLIYATGVDWMDSAAKELASNAAQVGIKLTATAEPFGTVAGDATGANGPSAWEMAFFGAWSYSPDYVPTGEELFLTGAAANFGRYEDPVNDADIRATLSARTPAEFSRAMYKWETYLAGQLPVVYEPDTPQLVETIKGLDTGVPNSALTITPEDWHWQK